MTRVHTIQKLVLKKQFYVYKLRYRGIWRGGGQNLAFPVEMTGDPHKLISCPTLAI